MATASLNSGSVTSRKHSQARKPVLIALAAIRSKSGMRMSARADVGTPSAKPIRPADIKLAVNAANVTPADDALVEPRESGLKSPKRQSCSISQPNGKPKLAPAMRPSAPLIKTLEDLPKKRKTDTFRKLIFQTACRASSWLYPTYEPRGGVSKWSAAQTWCKRP